MSPVVDFIAPAWRFISAMLGLRRRPKLYVHPFDPEHDLKYWHLDPPSNEVRRAVTLDVSNQGVDTAKRCVATLDITWTPVGVTLRERRYALHWADVPYSLRNTGSQPVDIGPEIQRLDVAFTRAAQDVPGCWIATPAALVLASIDQAYLRPGNYEGLLTVTCENGRGARLKVTLHSPDKWRDLSAIFSPA